MKQKNARPKGNPDLFLKLRGRVTECGMSHRELALLINRGHASISMKMTGQTPWNLDEMYAICKVLDIPSDQLHLYFPKNGVKETAAASYLSGQTLHEPS